MRPSLHKKRKKNKNKDSGNVTSFHDVHIGYSFRKQEKEMDSLTYEIHKTLKKFTGMPMGQRTNLSIKNEVDNILRKHLTEAEVGGIGYNPETHAYSVRIVQ